jgi:hypothetical protein
MPHRGMRAAHSPCTGVIDRAHEQQCQVIRHGQSKPVRHFARRHDQLHLSRASLIYRFLENTGFEGFYFLSPFCRRTNCRREIRIAIGVDCPYLMAALRQDARQDAGDCRFTASTFTCHRNFHLSLSFGALQNRFITGQIRALANNQPPRASI